MKRLLPLMAVVAMIAISGCALVDKAANKHIGSACTDQVRYDRSILFTDMLEKHYGEDFPNQIERLRIKSQLMLSALEAGDGLDAAGDSYKADFVTLAAKVLLKSGIEVRLGGFNEAAEKLKELPHLIADINEVEARIQISCAKKPPGGAVENADISA